MTLAQLQAYDSGWRTPTNLQNIAFVGTDVNDTATGSAFYTASTASTTPAGTWTNGSFSSSGGGLGVATFPHANTTDPRLNRGNVQLPASGFLGVVAGPTSSQGISGYFWSSTAYSATNGHLLYVYSSGVYPQNSYNFSDAFAVRCVPK